MIARLSPAYLCDVMLLASAAVSYRRQGAVERIEAAVLDTQTGYLSGR